MRLVFVDDSRQSPSRPGFRGRLVSVGAVWLPADAARTTEHALATACVQAGFPPGEEFKWSPRRDSWMFRGLLDEARFNFFGSVVDCLLAGEANAAIAMEDDGRSPANRELPAEQDVVVLLLERVANRLKDARETGLVVADRPGGDRREEDRFVAGCLASLEAGTRFVQHNEISFVLTTDSRFVRLLQAADVVTSALTAYVAGECVYSPPVVEKLLPLFPMDYNRRAGYSIKIHPSYNFANLHHWLFGESHWVQAQMGEPMPLECRDYAAGPNEP